MFSCCCTHLYIVHGHIWFTLRLGLDTCNVSNWTGIVAVMNRVKAFLPIMDEANRKLFTGIQERGPQEYDIEALDGDSGKAHIEMVRLQSAQFHSSCVILQLLFLPLLLLPSDLVDLSRIDLSSAF